MLVMLCRMLVTMHGMLRLIGIRSFRSTVRIVNTRTQQGGRFGVIVERRWIVIARSIAIVVAVAVAVPVCRRHAETTTVKVKDLLI